MFRLWWRGTYWMKKCPVKNDTDTMEDFNISTPTALNNDFLAKGVGVNFRGK